MNYLREAVLERVSLRELALIIALAGLASFLPFFIHIQWLVGPIVNAILIIVLFLSGLRSAIVVSAVPSLMALAGGLLPVFLAPAIPFIIASNIIFVSIIYYQYYNSNQTDAYWRVSFLGAFVKFTFLFLSAQFLSFFIANPKAATVLGVMLGWSQLFSALAGAIIAFGVLKMIKRI
ncbi:hypothetical protein COX68_00705 [Candidatus Falkowbacteria bacterium CG_4_10_14_0_2_um_filter_41_15]|uniref:Iron hydrogenase n=4 Tax=Candidatus Falkowiibacteriota TaxID=1752728 RepID=A0A2G9ZNZ6_9BACT|nr:MAG: hypothetical protein AUJ35_02530 [Candidatus Falkowbacteria bacterium CG1_02_41_21]PIP34864.1 MAG: hypothetical protein COX21_00580 [Candidatus Falkowbacteria bacterium CG23_combo_of_CG06-09_8_20_14_all_41_10]PIZ11583.1 MAG: hypothetical protein COY54_00165 [Candidatus Falkowbacteria bacterium CG_4_10_14_0_8_um_filter_41_36]PJA10351.1 MAG: hypothetical protein COX68_00705 [Candidatus Falkowbacteria bacterium CG_4_10_14_0_2_um_filter_41_15]